MINAGKIKAVVAANATSALTNRAFLTTITVVSPNIDRVTGFVEGLMVPSPASGLPGAAGFTVGFITDFSADSLRK